MGRPVAHPVIADRPGRSDAGRCLPWLNLVDHGITVDDVRRNLPPSGSTKRRFATSPTRASPISGALSRIRGAKTGRSPKDKRIVRRPESENDVWWGNVNVPLEPHSFEINRERAKDYLNTRAAHLLSWTASPAGTREHRVKVRSHLLPALSRRSSCTSC